MTTLAAGSSDLTSPESSELAKPESKWVIAGLCLVVASSILVEVCLTKFVSYKVFYHFVYAIISTVILSAGFAGMCVHLFARQIGRENSDPWNVAAKCALIYAITLIAATVLFCWLPFDPFLMSMSQPANSLWLSLIRFGLGSAPVALYFIIFAIPFFFAGICVSCTLAASKRSAAKIYFYDLLAAAAGALICPGIIEMFGGYGTILAASALAMGAFICYGRAGIRRQPTRLPWGLFAVAAILILVYPQWAMQRYGFDIRTMKTAFWHYLVLQQLKGISKTYWNAVARIDVTRSGLTAYFDSPFAKPGQAEYSCRFVLVDGAAPTRQLHVEGDLLKDSRLGGFLWSSPYIANPDIKRAVIIGAGGGIDVLIGKYFKAERIDALELNPSTYKHLLLGQDDPDASLYQPGLCSTAQTKVVMHNTEARHFCTTMEANSVDLIQATSVDTLTAITSGALAMVENYLYTSDAVKDYARILRPGGILSLTHWRTPSPGTSLRMFVTYLDYLDGKGIADPWHYVVVTGDDWWANELMKTTPFTPAEVDRLRTWAAAHGKVLLFDPYRKEALVPLMKPPEAIYSSLGFLTARERREALANYSREVGPVSDDKPFFYRLDKEDFFVSSLFFSTPLAFVFLIVTGSIVLFSWPVRRMKKDQLSRSMRAYAGCFALAGFAFLLSEAAVIQMFSVFVGGPVYALAVVLVSVLAGYAGGSWLSQHLKIAPMTYVVLGLVLAALFSALYLCLPGLIHALMPLGDQNRILICALLTFLTYLITGIPVSLAMTAVKRSHGDVVAWMWGVSCASNAIGAMCFTLIAQATGISGAFIIVAVLYLLASVGFALLSYVQQGRPAPQAISAAGE